MHKILIAGYNNAIFMDETAPKEEEMVITSSESLKTVLDALNEKQDVFIVHDDFYNEYETDLHINLNHNNLTKVFIIKEHDPVKQLERISEIPFEAYYLKKHRMDKNFLKTLLTFTSDIDNTYHYKDVSIDYQLKEVKVKNNVLVLTPMEYDLLIYLKFHQGLTLTRDELIKAVWGYSFLGDSRTIDTHIKSLRRKLGSFRCLIKTVWGKGYKFQEC